MPTYLHLVENGLRTQTRFLYLHAVLVQLLNSAKHFGHIPYGTKLKWAVFTQRTASLCLSEFNASIYLT